MDRLWRQLQMLAHLMKVDFEIEQASQVYDPAWWARVQNNELSVQQLRVLAEQQWGVVKELHFKLKVVKPGG